MTKSKETVVFFNGVYPPHLGGVERYTFELASRLAKFYNVHVVTSNTENITPVSTENGVKVFRLPVKELLKNRFPLLKKNTEYRILLSEIKALKIDHIIINTRFYETTFLGLKIAKEEGIKPIIIDHSGGYVLKSYEKLNIQKIKNYHPRFFSVSKTNQEFLKIEFNIDSEGVFYNAIEATKDFEKKQNEKLKVLFAGRLIKEKGLLDLLAAYEKLSKKYDFELIVVGDGKLYESVKNKYQNVNFLGHVDHDDVLKLFREADVFAFPTQYCEGFPTVLLEAGANKCATVIYDDGGGAYELVGGPENGAIAKARDIDDLARNLEKLLTDEKYRKKCQENLFKRVKENYVWDKTVKRIMEVLENEKDS